MALNQNPSVAMPIYEYVCGACGAASEINHRMSDPPAKTCPVCGKEALSKQISAAGFRLKGAGWYETDFKSANKRNLAADGGSSGASTADSGSGGGATTSSDSGTSKPASTPASSS